MSITIRPYHINDASIWDNFCSNCIQATFLHTRRFLSYHKDRFVDFSIIIEDDGDIVGLLPAAINPSESTSIISHPGLTYGGILHQSGLRGHRMILALAEICSFFHDRNFKSLIYKAVPIFYHQAPALDDLYALYRLGANCFRVDLSSLIDLRNRLDVSARRRRSLKKAVKAGAQIIQGVEYIPNLWDVLENNLKVKHGATPTHTLDEILSLIKLFPESIQCIAALIDNIVVAGIVVFKTPTAFHAQYIASSEIGYKANALDLVFEFAIDQAIAEGRLWFDFGISTEDQGNYLNSGLYCFKSEFGAGGAIHQFYELNLEITSPPFQ